jgi:acetyl esterase
MSLRTDPRCDPRIPAALAEFWLDANVPAPPVTPDSPREELLRFCAGAEESFGEVLGTLAARLPPVEGVTSETATIAGPDGNTIEMSIDRPTRRSGPTPGIVHLHGGGMVILRAADPVYVHWRRRLAAAGAVVIGVEFRNGAGRGGAHPFPAGLLDCAAAARWAAENRAELEIAAVVVSGESGGGSLTLALAHQARRQGWLSDIDGLYAQCPYISGRWSDPPPELPSLAENDGYFVSCPLFAVMAEVYDPGADHAGDPVCWPLQAGVDDLAELPPHVISVNELDPLRDEGLAYLRRLWAAGVSATGRVVPGTSHGADVVLGGVVPEAQAASVWDLTRFAGSLC